MKFVSADVDLLVAAVLESSKNRHVSPNFIRRFGEEELASQSSVKAAIKETKNRLHQAGGAYLEKMPNYNRWRSELAAAADEAAIRDLILGWMQSHSSTRERLPILGNFYSTILQSISPIQSVIDIACGLNPLAIGWMGLAAAVRYDAYDIYGDMTGFLTDYLGKVGVDGAAHVCDCAASPPTKAADMALILKFLPVLEQVEKGRTASIMAQPHRVLDICLPHSDLRRSSAEKNKGMARNYEARFLELVKGENWRIEKHVFENELCFLVKR